MPKTQPDGPDDANGQGGQSGSGKQAPPDTDILRIIRILAGAGCLLIALYALRFWPTGDALRIFGVAVMVAVAALAAGVLTGFIFGIPREGGAKKTGDSEGGKHSAKDAPENPIASNSNLVEISDWLTKIIVGIGLVELKSIPAKLGLLSYYVGRSLQPAQCGGAPACTDLILGGQSAALAIMIFYFALGFLWGVIWTKLIFQRILEDRNRQLEQEKEAAVQEKEVAVKEKKAAELEKVAAVQEKETIDFTVLAEKLIREGKLDEAMKQIDEALARNPNDSRAILTKGRIFKRQAMRHGVEKGEKHALLTQALTCVNRAIELTPPENRAELNYNKACYQQLLGFDKKQVLASLQAAFELKPDLRRTAPTDGDLEQLWTDADFIRLTGGNPPHEARG